MTTHTEIKIKVCGIKFPENRKLIEQLPVDLLGFIFYPPSKRYVGETPDPLLFYSTRPGVGVFVDSQPASVVFLAGKFGLEWVQLHGNESPETCDRIRSHGIKVIKAFQVNESFNFHETIPYADSADYLLFDTKTSVPGGSGKKFDWNMLDKYNGRIPFFLSGGIQPGDAENIRYIKHQQFAGIDVNSGFEDFPGGKNVEKLKQFIQEIKEQ